MLDILWDFVKEVPGLIGDELVFGAARLARKVDKSVKRRKQTKDNRYEETASKKKGSK